MSMQIFNFEKSTISVINNNDDIWFCGKTVSKILGYKDTKKAIGSHVDSEDKEKLGNFKGDDLPPLKKNEKNTIYINESGLYSLILRSKLEKAKAFKRWVTKDVLPSIRKSGKYEVPKPDALQERRLKLEEIKTYLNVYDKIDNPKLKTVIMDWMHNTISGQKAITDESTQYARDITDICKEEFGFIPDFGQKIKIGQILKKEYIKEFNQPLLKYEKYCNGSMRKVNAYPKDKERWIIETLQNYEDWSL
jgi:prophage antirepressor-like protein